MTGEDATNDDLHIDQLIDKKFRSKAEFIEKNANHEITVKIKISKQDFTDLVKPKQTPSTDRWVIFIGNGLCRAFKDKIE